MKMFKSILLAGGMLLATAGLFTSCQENAPEIDYEIKVTVINDFTKVVEAINQGALKNEQAIQQLTAAIDQMDADQQTKLQAITEVILSTGSTLDSKLAAIEAAIKAQTITAEGKLELIKQVLDSQNTTLDTKLAAIEAAIKEQTIGIEAKMDLVKGVLDSQNTTLDTKLTAIEATMKEQSIALTKKLELIEAAVKDQTKSLDERITLLNTAVNNMPKYEDKLDAITTAISSLDVSERLQAIKDILNGTTDKPGILTELERQVTWMDGIVKVVEDRLDNISAAIQAMSGFGESIDQLKEQMANLVKAVKDGTMSETDAMAEIGRKIELLKGVIGSGNAPVEQMEYVDLGLPSGKMWAKWNLGADRLGGHGNCFSWGETSPKADSLYYTKENYLLNDGEYGNFKRYNKDDGLKMLLPFDDAATVRLGSKWRTPTRADFLELYENCTMVVSEVEGHRGISFVSKKNGNYIFFRTTGFRHDGKWYGSSTHVRFWIANTSNRAGRDADYITLIIKEDNTIEVYPHDACYRYYGMPIRPVRD